MINRLWSRRDVIATGAALAALPGAGLADDAPPMLTRDIPASGESLPVIGLGTYSVFDVDSSAAEIAQKNEIVEMLIDAGGSVIDTSPMYNRSEKVVGDVISKGADRSKLFMATKVWTDGETSGVAQMRRSSELMNSDVIDLMQVHNLRDTAVHMKTIQDLKRDERVRYSGLTHYTAGAHSALEKEMQRYKPDFVQINYSLGEPEAAQRVLPLAQDLGIAVLINRPFQSGRLFNSVSGKSVPEWASAFAQSWGQFFLKFIVSHPAVTCAIPATSKAHHMADNLGAGQGELPDASMRKRMLDFFSSL